MFAGKDYSEDDVIKMPETRVSYEQAIKNIAKFFEVSEKIYIDETGKHLFKGKNAPKNHGSIGEVISEWKEATQEDITAFFKGVKTKKEDSDK